MFQDWYYQVRRQSVKLCFFRKSLDLHLSSFELTNSVDALVFQKIYWVVCWLERQRSALPTRRSPIFVTFQYYCSDIQKNVVNRKQNVKVTCLNNIFEIDCMETKDKYEIWW